MTDVQSLLKAMLESGQSDSLDTMDSLPSRNDATILTASSSPTSLLNTATTISTSEDMSSSVAVGHDEFDCRTPTRRGDPLPSFDSFNLGIAPTVDAKDTSLTFSALVHSDSCSSCLDFTSLSETNPENASQSLPLLEPSTPKQTKKHLRFAGTPSETRDTLRRKIRLLELSNQELMMTSDARAHTYQVKIKGLNSIIASLESDHLGLKEALAEKEKEIDMLKESRRVLMGATPTVDTSDKDTKDSKRTESLLNFEVIKENAKLREAVDAMQKKVNEMKSLYVQKQSTQELLPTTLSETKENVSSKNAFDEVDRILAMTQVRDENSSTSFHVSIDDRQTLHETVTALTEENASLKAQVSDLEYQLSSKESLLSGSIVKIDELQKTLDSVHSDLTALENNFASLQAETEIVKASDRLSRNTVQEQKETITEYTQQILQLNEQIHTMQGHMNRLHEEHEQYKHAQNVLNSMTKLQVHQLQHTLNESETLRADAMEQLRAPLHSTSTKNDFGENVTKQMDPISMLEAHWKADRNHLILELDLLKGSLQGKELELERLKTEYEEKIMTLHDENEWALLLAKYAVAENDAKQLDEQVKTQTSVIEMLQSQVENLERLLDKAKKEKNSLRDKVAKLTQDSERHEKLYKEVKFKREDFENQLSALESKNKSLALSVTNKDRLIRDFKQKIALLERTTVGDAEDREVMDTIQVSIKSCRQDLIRKNSLLKHWKDKVSELKFEIGALKEAEARQVDPRVVTTLQKHLREMQHRNKDLEMQIEGLEAKEQHFHRAIHRLFEAVYELHLKDKSSHHMDRTKFSTSLGSNHSEEFTLVNINPDDVNATAQELAKSILDIDLDTIFEVPKAKPQDVFSKLKEILSSSTSLEGDLHTYFLTFLPVS